MIFEMKYPNLVILFLYIALPLNSFSQNSLCDAAYNSNFQEIESLFKAKVRTIRKDRSFNNNHERIDSLENWFANFDCVKEVFWNRNDAFILTTLTFHRSLTVIFETKDSLAEICFTLQTLKQRYGDRLYWRWGVDVPNRKLTYISYQFCPGYIQKRKDSDSINQRNQKIEKHNFSVRFGLSIVNSSGQHDNYHGKLEGGRIYVKFSLKNVSDSLKIVPWPSSQNDGLKMVYFELTDKRRRHILTENRDIEIPHNESIRYNLIHLEPGEERLFYHEINATCLGRENQIECEHKLGLIKEGEYFIHAWYNPFGPDYPAGVWLPRERDSLIIRGQDYFRVIRTTEYYAQKANLGPDDRWTVTKRSQLIFNIELKGTGGKYQSDIGKIGYDGWGIVRNVELGNLNVGDTVAFTLRGEENLKFAEKLQKGKFFKIHVTKSEAECFQIPASQLPFTGKKGITNFQMVNYPEAIQKIKKP